MKRVLIVDDSRFIYEEMKYMLTDTEYEVVGYVSSGEQALEEYERLKPDVVTMDIILPGIDGIETTSIIAEKYPMAQVLVVSSLAYDETIQESKRVGAKGFIFKPFTSQTLIDALEKVSCAAE